MSQGTPLETAMTILLETFRKYAGTDGKKNSLSKSELKTLLEKELPCLIPKATSPKEVDELLASLDFNGDSEVDFNEFMATVATLCCLCNKLCCE